MITLEELDELERCAAAGPPGVEAGAPLHERTTRFERAAAPYRALARSARLLLESGRVLGPELEEELRRGARALSAMRRWLGVDQT